MNPGLNIFSKKDLFSPGGRGATPGLNKSFFEKIFGTGFYRDPGYIWITVAKLRITIVTANFGVVKVIFSRVCTFHAEKSTSQLQNINWVN